jgi:phospholipase/lecithinase/hemolysin
LKLTLSIFSGSDQRISNNLQGEKIPMKKQAVATGVFFLSCLWPLRASAETYSQLYVFGDSLSDTGNVFKATGGLIPPAQLGYYDGRFSNGLNWVEYLAQDLGLNPNPNTNYAFGGATTGSTNTVLARLPGLQQEIAGFTQTNPIADPNGLYIIWAGANDYLGGGVTDPTVPLTNLSNAVTSLANVGAKNIMVANMPNLGIIPSSNGDSQLSTNLSLLSTAHDTGLTQTLGTLEQQLGSSVNLTELDVYSLFNTVIANPAEYNFTNVTTACLSVTSCALGNQSKQDQYLFWDNLHPTTAAQKIIGDFAFSTLNSAQPTAVPEAGSTLGVLAFGVLGVGLKLKRKPKKASSVKNH